MRINGLWHPDDDGVYRPVIQGDVLSATGVWTPTRFLVDTGADRSVLSADILDEIGFQGEAAASQIAGVGGRTASVEVPTPIRLFRDNGVEVQLNGRFAAFTDPDALDMSILGRDVLNLFAVIVDRKQDVVCLLAQGHGYEIRLR